jgi:hypothetical protein
MCPRLSANIVAQNPGDNVMPASPPGQAGAAPAGVAAPDGKALDASRDGDGESRDRGGATKLVGDPIHF